MERDYQQLREWTSSARRSISLLPRQFSQEPTHGIVEIIYNSLFERNDCIVGDVYIFGANLGAAFSYVAVADTELLFQQLGSIQTVKRMHFKPRHAHKESRSAELFLLVVIAQHVANVLAQEALDALAKFLDAIHLALIHLPLNIWSRREGRNLFVNAIVPRNIGNKILEHRKALHRLYGNWLVNRQRIESGLTSQPRVAVDFRRARTALAGFTIPAHSQVGRVVRLNVMQRIEYNHAWGNRHFVFDKFAAVTVAAKDFECCVRHKRTVVIYFFSSKIARRSEGISAIGACLNLIASPSRKII